MLPVILLATDGDLRARLWTLLERAAAERKMSVSLVVSTGSVRESGAFLGDQPGILLLAVHPRSEDAPQVTAIATQAIDQCRDSYICVLAEDMQALETMINACTRPAGIVLPPFDPERILPVLRRILDDYRSLLMPRENQLLLQVSGGAHRLPVEQIVYIEANNKKLHIWTNRQCISVYETLENIIGKLDETFLRCHRSYVVNTRHVRMAAFATMELVMQTGQRVPFSRANRAAVRTAFAQDTVGE